MGYIFSTDSRIWRNSEYDGICYNDGDETENRIAHIVATASDLSVFSLELASHCKDWPTTYHLSRKRGNLLRPFEDQLRDKSVLEIGAGCGAITRYLGETGAEVLALEGSLRRASIAASRCRDLPRVTVLAEAFHRFKPAQQFDVVTLVGVLEYARKFFPAEGGDPVDALLAAATGFLKPRGKLIIAIENQLGLKYFAGFPEDHVGKPMFGIEGQYGVDGVVTFGRRELAKRVGKAGLPMQEWWYPFPDYKVPSLIISEAGALPQDDVDLSPAIRSACLADPQYPLSLSFNPERAWRPVVHNGLLGDLANSFLLLASDTRFSRQEDLPLAVHFATERRPEFAKKVVFKRAHGRTVVAHQTPLLSSSARQTLAQDEVIKQQLIDQPYISGELWQDRLLQIMTSPGWSIGQIQEWMKIWLDAFCVFSGIATLDNITEKGVSGRYIDAIPRNIIFDENRAPVFIDQEWIFAEDLDVGYLCFRALLTSLSSIKVVAKPLEDCYLSVLPLITCVMRSINLELDEHRISRYLHLETRLHKLTTGMQPYSTEELVSWFTSLELQVFDTHTPVHQKLAQRDEQITLSLAQCERQLNEIRSSTSWGVTRPLRALGRWLKSA